MKEGGRVDHEQKKRGSARLLRRLKERKLNHLLTHVRLKTFNL